MPAVAIMKRDDHPKDPPTRERDKVSVFLDHEDYIDAKHLAVDMSSNLSELSSRAVKWYLRRFQQFACSDKAKGMSRGEVAQKWAAIEEVELKRPR